MPTFAPHCTHLKPEVPTIPKPRSGPPPLRLALGSCNPLLLRQQLPLEPHQQRQHHTKTTHESAQDRPAAAAQGGPDIHRLAEAQGRPPLPLPSLEPWWSQRASMLALGSATGAAYACVRNTLLGHSACVSGCYGVFVPLGLSRPADGCYDPKPFGNSHVCVCWAMGKQVSMAGTVVFAQDAFAATR